MQELLKAQFPIFEKYPDLIYLDNAATTQRTRSVIEAINQFNAFENSNIHRGVYDLSNHATQAYEKTRQQVAHFLGVQGAHTIAFTKGTTESVNIVAHSFLRHRLEPGDNMVVTIMEHHANFIPWQMLAKQTGSELRVLTVDTQGNLAMDQLDDLLDKKTKILSLNHVSNTLGTVNDIQSAIEMAHRKEIPVMIDAAQSAAYYDLNVNSLDYDFLAFSGHKMFGPFGIGVLYAHPKYHEEIRPFAYGGGMIKDVSVEETVFNDFPYNLDAGTANISAVVGLAKAIDFVSTLDKKWISEHLQVLKQSLHEELAGIEGVNLIGNPQKQSGIVSFTIDDIHPHDIASFFNQDQIAVRAGMHCTQPLLSHLGVPATVRVSFSVYNSSEEVNRLSYAVKELKKFWS